MSEPTPTSRRFALIRTVDHTGVSGVGAVADGVEFHDGSVALRWHGEHASTVVWSSIEHAIAVHGHDGATTVHWFDDENGEPVDPVERRTEAMNAAHSVLWAGGDNPTTLQAAEVVQLAEWLMYGDYRQAQRVVSNFTGAINEAKAQVRKSTNPPF
jgi:hypothetical protein